MGMVKTDLILLGVGVVGVMLLASYIKGHAGEMAAAIPHVVADAGAGLVIGTGEVLGIPRTNETECQAALREGRTLDASFACPAGTFLGSVFGY